MNDDYVEIFFDQLHKRFAEAENNPPKETGGVCLFNHGVMCDIAKDCDTCGWNPTVAKKRLARLREARSEEN